MRAHPSNAIPLLQAPFYTEGPVRGAGAALAPAPVHRKTLEPSRWAKTDDVADESEAVRQNSWLFLSLSAVLLLFLCALSCLSVCSGVALHWSQRSPAVGPI